MSAAILPTTETNKPLYDNGQAHLGRARVIYDGLCYARSDGSVHTRPYIARAGSIRSWNPHTVH